MGPASPYLTSRTLDGARRFALWACIASIALCLVVLAAWLIQAMALGPVPTGITRSKPNTALALLLLAAATLATHRLGRDKVLVGLLAGAGGMIGAVTLLQFVLRLDFGIDQFLFVDPAVTSFPGRMAPLTAVGLMSLGLTFLLRVSTERTPWLREALAVVPLACGLLGIIGKLYGFHFLTGLGVHLEGMGAISAVCLVLLGAAVLALEPRRGMLADLLANRAGGRFGRAVLPVALAFPVIVGWLRVLGERAGYFDTPFGILILVVSMMIVFSTITIISARRLNRSQEILLDAQQELESRIRARTTELETNLARLRAEIVLREAAEASQAESKSALRSAIENAPIGMALLGQDGRFQRVNRALCDIVGYDERTLLAKTFQDITHPDDLDADLALVARLVNGEIPSYQMEKRYIRGDGTSTWVMLSVSLVRDAARNPLFFVAQIEDISLRRAAERELSASRQFLADVISSIPIPMTVKDDAGRIVIANPSMSAFHGKSLDEIMGRTDAEMFTPERARAFRAEDQALLRTGIPLIEEQNFNTLAGEPRWVIKRKHRVMLADGKPCVLTTLLDITARKQAEVSLRDSEERFRSLTALSSDWYWEQDSSFRFTIMSGSTQAIIGISPQETIGKARWELPYVNMSSEAWKAHRRVLELHKPFSDLELVRELPDGSRRYAVVSGEPVFDGLDEFRGYRGTGRNITALRLAQIAAADARTFLEAVIEAIPQAIFLKDKEHRWVLFNTAFVNIMGRSREELIGQNDALLFPPDIVQRVYAEDDKVMAEGALTVEERGVPYEDGSERWLFKSKRRVALNDGSYYIAGVSIDITRMKQTQEALRKSDELHRLLADNSSDLISLMSPAGVIQYASTASTPLLGRSPEQLTGRLVADLIHPDDRAQSLRIFQEVVRTLQPVVFSCRLQKSDDAWTWIETSFRAIPEADNPSRTRQVIAVSRDINERIRVTAALNHFKYVLDNTLDMIFIYDVGTLRFNYVNEGAARALGIPRDKLIGMAPWEVRADIREQEYLVSIQPFLSGEITSRQVEAVHRRADGSLMPVEVTMQLVRRPGEPGTFISVARDLTERKKVERMKSEFISTVSHELRTPVTSIRGSLGLLGGGVAGRLPKQARQLVDIAVSNSDRLIRLINDILDMEKIESGKMAFVVRPVALRHIVSAALESNQGYADKFGVHFEVSGKVPDQAVVADADRILQVMANLMSNAAKFSPPGGKVMVGVALRGNMARISVTDHGGGIPAEFHDKIFAKFSQADASDTRRLGGSGLGLSIAKAIVEKHGGEIGFVTTPGAGTTFHFDLPLAPRTVASSEPAEPADQPLH